MSHESLEPSESEDPKQSVAVVGMACRFPGAQDVKQFWENLKQGVESISTFTDEELKAVGVSPELLGNKNYIKRKGILSDIELFDYSFFGYSPNEAKLIDPQQRLFLECVWEALESAGCSSKKYSGIISIYGGMADSTYFLNNLLKNSSITKSLSGIQRRIATGMSTLATQAAYRLDLKGAGINMNTACSTSLVLVAEAYRSLIDYETDVAIAGAVAIDIPQTSGYLAQEGDIVSLDGFVRAFDADANGTVFSNGVGAVILKRLEDAIQDGDHIYACIRGYGLNNDGADKTGYSTVSIEGQASCIASPLSFSGVSADTLGYVEAHGTGTALGDPVEVTALSEAFRRDTERNQFCALGSVKTNIGHTDIAAGMASLIKTILAVKEGCIPPTLHYQQPNPHIDFEHSPFYVNTNLIGWKTDQGPRRAGVSAFGIRGTIPTLL